MQSSRIVDDVRSVIVLAFAIVSPATESASDKDLRRTDLATCDLHLRDERNRPSAFSESLEFGDFSLQLTRWESVANMERRKMVIQGTAHVHAPQVLSAPHRVAPAQAPSTTPTSFGVDQLDISPEADLVAQVHDLPEIREDRVAQIKAQIAAGTYETDAKLDVALSRLLDEIG